MVKKVFWYLLFQLGYGIALMLFLSPIVSNTALVILGLVYGFFTVSPVFGELMWIKANNRDIVTWCLVNFFVIVYASVAVASYQLLALSLVFLFASLGLFFLRLFFLADMVA